MLRAVGALALLAVVLGLVGRVEYVEQQELAARVQALERDLAARQAMLDEAHALYRSIIERMRRGRMLEVDLSAYTARVEECDATPEVTAIMEPPVPGWTVAVSRDMQHMLGARVYIEGIGVRRVNDLMNPRYNRRVDLLVPTVAEAKQVGVRNNVKMVVLE